MYKAYCEKIRDPLDENVKKTIAEVNRTLKSQEKDENVFEYEEEYHGDLEELKKYIEKRTKKLIPEVLASDFTDMDISKEDVVHHEVEDVPVAMFNADFNVQTCPFRAVVSEVTPEMLKKYYYFRSERNDYLAAGKFDEFNEKIKCLPDPLRIPLAFSIFDRLIYKK